MGSGEIPLAFRNLRLLRASLRAKGKVGCFFFCRYSVCWLRTSYVENESIVYIRSFISLWSKKDMKSCRGCGDEGRYRGVWSR